jgi:hypothetical protein
MRTSEQINDLVSVLAKARADFEPIVRSKTVTVKSDRGSYQFSYAPRTPFRSLCPPRPCGE